jgi:hypothetical protein
MSFAQSILARARPDSVRSLALPRRTNFFPSPTDWRDEVIYFLLPDRFSDGGESDRPLVNPKDRGANRPRSVPGTCSLQSHTDSEVISPAAMAGGNTGLVLCQVGGQ